MRGYRLLAIAALCGWVLSLGLRLGLTWFVEPRELAAQSRPWLQQLSRPAAGCRVVLFGSSPVLFGLDAGRIEQATGCQSLNLAMPSVGNRLEPFLKDVASKLRPGDTLVFTDRAWTNPEWLQAACSSLDGLGCAYSFLSNSPSLADDFAALWDWGLKRTVRGDLISYPDSTGSRPVGSRAALGDVGSRLELMAKEFQIAKRRGVRVVLAGAPLLAAPEGADRLATSLARLHRLADAKLGACVWVPSWVETDPSFFLADGSHASVKGRARWTEIVLDHLMSRDSGCLEQLAAEGHSGRV